MKKMKNNRGLTLIEVIASLAIFGIVSVGLLSIFTESLLITSRAGARSEAVMNISTEIENKLANPTYSSISVLNEDTTHQATIYYNYGTMSQSSNTMDGNLVTGNEINDRGQEVEVVVFIPEAVSP